MAYKGKGFAAGRQKVITYAGVIQELNNIAKDYPDDTAHFATDLLNEYNRTTCGFVYSGYGIGARLAALMDNLGIKYSHMYRTPDPTKGELQINPEYATQATDLFANWMSWVCIEPHMTGNKKIDNRWRQIVNITAEKIK